MLKSYNLPRDLEKYCNALKKNGLKATAQRVAIHEAMLEMGHASADMVYDWLERNSDTRVTVASVYNTLSQLSELGIYGYRMSANNKMYFDVFPKPHIHLYDCVNHTFRDINDEKLQTALLERIGLRRFRGYRIENVDIQFIVRPITKK